MEHLNPCRQLALAPWPPASWLAPTVIEPVEGAVENVGPGSKPPVTVTGADATALPNLPRRSIDKHGILTVRPKSIARIMSSLPPAEVMDTMAGPGATALPNLPRDIRILDYSHHHSITDWKAALKSLKRSVYKAGAEGAGAPELPTIPSPEGQADRWGSEWPRMAGSAAHSGVVTSETLEKVATGVLQETGGKKEFQRPQQ